MKKGMLIEVESFSVGKSRVRYDTPNSVNNAMKTNALGRGKVNISLVVVSRRAFPASCHEVKMP
jgi:hypothetical protein